MKIKYANLLLVLLLAIFAAFPASAQVADSFTYSEGWWEVLADPNEPEPDGLGGEFLLYQNADLRLNYRVTTEINPGGQVHGVNQTARVSDAESLQQLASGSSNDFYTGGNTIFTATTSYDIEPKDDGDGMGPFKLDATVQNLCPVELHTVITVDGGNWGTSAPRYDYNGGGRPGSWYYVHMYHPGQTATYNACWTNCGNVPRKSVVAYHFGHGTPGNYIRLYVPYGPAGCFTWGGPMTFNATAAACFDIWIN